ncbi:MAG TPA: MoaD/ThiS family protein [Chloroflexota bacterium]|nr:MoaD/ThiS family protein [Chloroflexota bacterium]
MIVSVLLFAAYREIVGQSRIELNLPEGATAEDVYDQLQTGHPRLRDARASTTFAVNRQVVDPEYTLHGGDEVALLQPASGGSR